ncbi:MAG: hypothetical protein AB7I59_12430 [Geminicoccaceae bacterium]
MLAATVLSLLWAGTASAGVPSQLYEAHASRVGTIDRIGGSFAVRNLAGGGFADEGVDFSFSATRP